MGKMETLTLVGEVVMLPYCSEPTLTNRLSHPTAHDSWM